MLDEVIGKPKLGWHGGKVFSVYCGFGFEWELASQVQPKNGEHIKDFSIGGDTTISLVTIINITND